MNNGTTTGFGLGESSIFASWTADGWFFGPFGVCDYTPEEVLRDAICEIVDCLCVGTPLSEAEWNFLSSQFPHLERCQSRKLAAATSTYNCLAWTIDDTSQWWWSEAEETRGQVQWSLTGGVDRVVIGRSEQVDLVQGISSNYACQNCCPNSFFDGWVTPVQSTAFEGDQIQFIAMQQDMNCYGQVYPAYQAGFPSFTSSDLSICNPDLTTGTTTGVGPGEAIINGVWTGDAWLSSPTGVCDYDPVEVLREALCDVLCTFPQGETTTSAGWSTLDPTVHRWNQTLTGGINFSGRSVTEQEGTASDTCHFPNSDFPPATLDGSTWPVNTSNQWGPDFVGWYPSAVNYYRAQGRAPCGATIQQLMSIDCPRGPIHYITNTIGGDINLTTVISRRAGSTAIRTWP